MGLVGIAIICGAAVTCVALLCITAIIIDRNRE